MTGDHRRRGRIRGKDDFQTKAQPLEEEVHRCLQIGTRNNHFSGAHG